MKKCMMLLIVSLNIYLLFSQQVNIDFALTWEKGRGIFQTDTLMCIPTLHINYFNDSNKKIFLKKHSNPEKSMPGFICSFMFNIPFEDFLKQRRDYLKKAENAIKHSKSFYSSKHYYVYFALEQFYDNGVWEILDENVNFDEEHESALINCDLRDIYEYILHEYNKDHIDTLNNYVSKLYFSKDDITEYGILNFVSNQFVFLNPNETYSDSFNLIGFQYLGGTFSFKILPNTNKNYVVAEPYWDKTLEKWVYPEIMLPLKVGEYELYQGQFMSNELTVKFPVHECDE